MSKTFIYEVDGKRDGEYEEVSFTVDDNELTKATVDIIMEQYFEDMGIDDNTHSIIRQRVRKLVFYKDLENQFEEELKDYFEYEALRD